MKRNLLYVWVLILLGAVSCQKDELPGSDKPERPDEAIVLTADETERLPLFETDYNRSHKEVLALADGLMKQIAKEEQQTKAVIPARTAVLSDSIVIAFPATKSAMAQMPQEAKIYVVNFGTKAGFSLVAGDKRVQSAVLAYDGSGEFDVNTDNPGAQLAMELMKEYIQSEIERMEAMRGDSVYTTLEAKYGFGAANNTGSGEVHTKGYDAPYFPMEGMPGSSPDNPYGTRQGSNWQVVTNGITWYWAPVDQKIESSIYSEEGLFTQVYPILPTQWGQNWPYDVEVVKVYPNCPVGCVATAMAQIMAYYKKPAGYMWDSYGYNIQSKLDTERNSSYAWESKSTAAINNIGALFFWLGDELEMQYATTGSGALSSMVPGVFQKLGYHSAGGIMNLNISSVETQMEEKQPVYISGNRLIQYGKRGHAWVVDGLSQIANYSTTQYSCLYQGENVGYIPVRTVNYYRDQKYFHCNWGWNGKDNGWYLAGTFDPGSYDYKYDLKMLTDIR